MTTGSLFKTTCRTVVGTADGLIYVLNNNVLEEVLQSKGSCVLSLLLYDFNKFSSNDLASGDSLGNIIMFSHDRIIGKSNVASSVTSMAVDIDHGNNLCLIVADRTGSITAFCSQMQTRHKWKLRIEHNAHATALLSVNLPDAAGVLSHYLLVATSDSRLLFLGHQGVVVFELTTPEVVTAMCRVSYNGRTEVAIACEDHHVYKLDSSFCFSAFINTPGIVTSIVSISLEDDYLLLFAGHFACIEGYRENYKVVEYDTPDWVHTLSIGDVNQDGIDEVVALLVNNSVQCYQLSIGQTSRLQKAVMA